MSIKKCAGPLGETGFQAVVPGHPDGQCHLVDPNLDRSEGSAVALRAAMRDHNMIESDGDPRMARDG